MWARLAASQWQPAGAASRVQSADGTQVTGIRFAGDNGATLRALLYVPAGVDAAHKAPAILAVHGYINTAETQSAFAIELARRGFVVLAIDMTGHGWSGGVLRSDGYGGPDSLKYLRSLPYVDVNNIGLEGHSLGGGPVQAVFCVTGPTAPREAFIDGEILWRLISHLSLNYHSIVSTSQEEGRVALAASDLIMLFRAFLVLVAPEAVVVVPLKPTHLCHQEFR